MRHGISLREVAQAAGKSVQWVNKVELCRASASNHNQYEMMKAFQHVILERRRALSGMEAEYMTLKRSLLKEEAEWTVL